MKSETLKRTIGYTLLILLPLATFYFIAKDIGAIYILVPLIATIALYILLKLFEWLLK